MIRVILDTNFLVSALGFNIDIFSELGRVLDKKYRVCVLDKTIDELEKLINQSKGSRSGRMAKFGLQLIAQERFKVIPTLGDEDVDSLLVKLQGGKVIIATQDKILKRKIKKSPLLIIKQKKYFQLQNVL